MDMTLVMGFVGVIVGASIPIGYQIWDSNRSKTQSSTYSAIRAVASLNDLVQDCIDAIYSVKNASIPGHDEYTKPNAPVFVDDIDWKLLPSNLTYECLLLPSKYKQSEEALRFYASVIGNTPDDGFDTQFQHQWAKLGVIAHSLAKAFCHRYQLPELQFRAESIALLHEEAKKDDDDDQEN